MYIHNIISDKTSMNVYLSCQLMNTEHNLGLDYNAREYMIKWNVRKSKYKISMDFFFQLKNGKIKSRLFEEFEFNF